MFNFETGFTNKEELETTYLLGLLLGAAQRYWNTHEVLAVYTNQLRPEIVFVSASYTIFHMSFCRQTMPQLIDCEDGNIVFTLSEQNSDELYTVQLLTDDPYKMDMLVIESCLDDIDAQ